MNYGISTFEFPLTSPTLHLHPNDAFLLPIDKVNVVGPTYHRCLARDLPGFSITHPHFPTVWDNTVERFLLESKNGYSFWRHQILSKKERPQAYSDDKKIPREVLHSNWFYERSTQLSAYLSCIAFSEYREGCDEALEDPSQRYCGGHFIQHGGGLGSKYLIETKKSMVNWSQSYLLFDDVTLPSYGSAFVCYGLADPTDIHDWRPYLANPKGLPQWTARDDLQWMETHNPNKHKETDIGRKRLYRETLWKEWVSARHHNYHEMRERTHRPNINYIKKGSDPVATIVPEEDDALVDPRLFSINGVAFDATTIPVQYITVRQWISPTWMLGLTLKTMNVLPKESVMVIKPDMTESPCAEMPMTHALAMATPVPGQAVDGNEPTYHASFSGMTNMSFLGRLRHWSQLLHGRHDDIHVLRPSDLMPTRRSTEVDTVTTLCYYPTPTSLKGVKVGTVKFQSRLLEIAILVLMVLHPTVALPITLCICISCHFMLQRKMRLKICRENIRHSRSALEEKMSNLNTCVESDGSDSDEDVAGDLEYKQLVNELGPNQQGQACRN